MTIKFFFQKEAKLKDRKRLKQFLTKIFNSEKQEAIRLDIIFCDDEYLLQVNRDFLQHDYYTDIISFNLAAENAPVEGELYISVDRVAENAGTYNIPFQTELHRVIFHGVLHLCGYNDKSRKDIALMREREDYYLKQYFEVTSD